MATDGHDRLALGDLTAGQTVELTDVKHDEGLTAQTIRVQADE